MRILYDLRASQPLQGDLHGGGVHALAVLEGLVGRVSGERVTAYYDARRPIDPTAVEALRAMGAPLLDVRSDQDLRNVLASEKYHRLYSSLPYDLYRYDLSTLELVMTIHGLRAVEMPADRYESRYVPGMSQRVKASIRRAGAHLYVRRQVRRFRRLLFADTRGTTIIVPSLHTKHALLSRFPGLDADALHVAYSPLRGGTTGDESVPAPPPGIPEEFGNLDRDYFLLVNAGRWIKNGYRAIVALDRFFDAWPESKLRVVVTGVKPGTPLESSPRHQARFQFHDYVADDVLQALYSRAFALLYPTLNEGFGYPPVEAMKWGTPVICSAVSSVPEICDGAALYANPISVEEWQNRISQLALEPHLWKLYAERGPRRYREVEALQEQGLDRICRLVLGRAPSGD